MESGGGGVNERAVDLKFISYYCHELSTKNMVALPLPFAFMKSSKVYVRKLW